MIVCPHVESGCNYPEGDCLGFCDKVVLRNAQPLEDVVGYFEQKYPSFHLNLENARTILKVLRKKVDNAA